MLLNRSLGTAVSAFPRIKQRNIFGEFHQLSIGQNRTHRGGLGSLGLANCGSALLPAFLDLSDRIDLQAPNRGLAGFRHFGAFGRQPVRASPNSCLKPPIGSGDGKNRGLMGDRRLTPFVLDGMRGGAQRLGAAMFMTATSEDCGAWPVLSKGLRGPPDIIISELFAWNDGKKNRLFDAIERIRPRHSAHRSPPFLISGDNCGPPSRPPPKRGARRDTICCISRCCRITLRARGQPTS